MNFIDFCIYWAAFVLAMIILANFFAPKKLGYKQNLDKMEPFLAEIFRVHCGYTMLTMLGMLLTCVCYHTELRSNEEMGFGFNLFMAVFWGSRVLIQVFFYNYEIKKKYPIFNVIFLTAFGYLGILFTYLVLT